MLYLILATIISLSSSLLLIAISKKIGYLYGPKRNALAVIVSTLTGLCLMGLTLYHIPNISLKGFFYVQLFNLACMISLSSLFIDLKYKEIPDYFNLATALLGGLGTLLYPHTMNQAILLAIGFFALYFLIMVITNAMGGGDVKMVGALGLFVPFSYAGFFLIAPFAIGSIIAVYLMVIKKQSGKVKIAFGPYIAIAFILTSFLYWGGF